MELDKRLQNVRNDAYDAELKDTEKWTSAKVNECIVSAVMMARRLSLDDPAVKKMLADWPDDSSVRFEWFRNIATRPEIKIPENQSPNVNTLDNVYRVLARWLHLIDSNMERTVIILHACGLSFKTIAGMFPEQRWTEKTLSRRYNERLNKFVYALNHIEELKWSAGEGFYDFETSDTDSRWR